MDRWYVLYIVTYSTVQHMYGTVQYCSTKISIVVQTNSAEREGDMGCSCPVLVTQREEVGVFRMLRDPLPG